MPTVKSALPLAQALNRAGRRPDAVRLLALAAAALLLAGCTLVKDPEPRQLSGPTDGYTPTATYLKLHVKRDDGTTALLDFDRRDWYTAGIAKMVDQKDLRFVVAEAMPRDILNEYVAREVATPDELQGLRFDAMDASPEQRAEMDREYELLLQAFLATVPEAASPPGAAPLLPAAPLP